MKPAKIAGAAALIIVGMVALVFLGLGTDLFVKVADADNVLAQQEEFHRLHNDAQGLCDQIKILEETKNDSTATFSQKSKIENLKLKLSRTIKSYNTKSSSLNAKYFKDENLPKTLSINDICSN